MEVKKLTMLRVAVLLCVAVVCAPGFAEDRELEDLPRAYRDFLQRERTNSTKIGDVSTQVDEKYQPEAAQTIRVNYVEVPLDDLHFVDSGLEAHSIRQQVIVKKKGKKHLRFFIHPESEKLYAPLIKKYGVAGYFNAAATASTRSMLMWNPKSNARPFFAKLSLDKIQDILGRSISDWEVRRSVAITKLSQETSDATWKRNKTTIIPEVFGAYVDRSYGMKTYIDSKQGNIKQHGLIFRDASFIEDGNVYPAFTLLSEREGGKEPLLVEWWRKSKMPWRKFIKERFFEPLGQSVNYMSMVEGMHPDFHLQNFLVRVDPKNGRILEVYHRDLGSFKVDLRMRAARGKSTEALRTENPHYDFKPEWGHELYGKALINWCWSCNFASIYSNFRGGYKVLSKHVPRYDPETVLRVVEEVLRSDARKHWKSQPGDAATEADFGELANEFIESRLKLVTPDDLSEADAKAVQQFINHQRRKGQVITMPQWTFDWDFRKDSVKVTDHGVLYAKRSLPFGRLKPMLALYTSAGGPEDIFNRRYEVTARPASCGGIFGLLRRIGNALRPGASRSPNSYPFCSN